MSRFAAAIVTVAFFLVGVVPSLHAQTVSQYSPSGQAAVQYSASELEQVRTQMLQLVDSIQTLARFAPPHVVNQAALMKAKGQIQQMSYAQLNTLRQEVDPSQIASKLQQVQAGIQVAKAAGLQSAAPYNDANPLPVASEVCTGPGGTSAGPSRIPVSVVIAADVVYFIAENVKDAAQDACKETVVVAGEGGNTSLACIAVDVIYVAAAAVNEGIHFCDDDVSAGEIDANYARLADVHTDVNNVGTTLDTHITTANTDIDNRIAAANAEIDNRISVLSALTTMLVGDLSGQMGAATNKLVAGQYQLMKLDLTPSGLRKLVGTILTCDGTAAKPCPDVLLVCQTTGCSWNKVGTLR